MNTIEYQIFFLSLLPITELRATIPLAQSLGIEPLRAFIIAVGGNLIPIIPLLFGLEPLSRLLINFPIIYKLFNKLLIKTRDKGKQVNRYGFLGLFLFVAIPFPGTGAYSGAILAWLLGFNKLYSFIAITGGVILAGILVSLASIGIIKTATFLEIEYLLGILLIVAIVLIKRRKKS